METESLANFWATVYPWDAVLRFCTADRVEEKLANTEFMFDIGNSKMVRNNLRTGKRLQFATAEEMREFTIATHHPVIATIHRGSTYFDLQNVKWEKNNTSLRLWYPLVIDVDATDYSEVRTCPCGKEKRVCKHCWDAHVVPAVDGIIGVCKTLGFARVQAVFSGRRGMHVYVLDEKACLLLPPQRRMIVERIKRRGIKLDERVSYEVGHTLKMPCTPHPATWNVCCPLSPEEYHTFNPETMGTPYSKVTPEQMQYWGRMLLENLE